MTTRAMPKLVDATPAGIPKSMLALTLDVQRDRWESTKGFTLEEVPTPVLDEEADPGDAENALIRVRYAGFCGSDRGIWWRTAFRDMIERSLQREGKTTRIIGHELVGEIVAIGSLARRQFGYREGTIVSTESHIICGKCLQCRIGETHVCSDDVIIGISRDGCFAQYIKLPAAVLWPTDSSRVRMEVAAVQEPFGNAVHICQAVDLRGKTVAIFGTGTVGLFTILAARAMGASKIYGVEPNGDNRVMAKHLGCDEVIPLRTDKVIDPARPWAHDPAVVAAVRDCTGGTGVDVAIEMAGNNASLNNAIKSVRRGGAVVLFGIKNADFNIEDYNRVVLDGIFLHAVVGRRIFSTWNTVKHLLESKENRIEERIYSVILRSGEDTIVDFQDFEPKSFEQRIRTYPKVLFRFPH